MGTTAIAFLSASIPLQDAATCLNWLRDTSVQVVVLAGIILVAQYTVGRWLSPQWRYRLWGLLVLRLVLPVLPPSAWSVSNVDLAALARPAAHATDAPVAPPPAPTAPPPAAASDDNAPSLVVRAGTYPLRAEDFRPVATHHHEPPPGVGVGRVLVAVWLSGAGLLLVHLFVANWRFARRLRDAVPITDPTTLAVLDRCRREMGLRAAPPLLATGAVRGPAVAGAWRPRLLVPAGLVERLTPEELRMVFLHELAHVRCRDVLANWVLAVVQAVHWFNPLVWLAFARCRADREIARDAMVLARLAADTQSQPQSNRQRQLPEPETYGRTLLKLLDAVGRLPGAARPATAGVLGLVGLVTAVGIFDGHGRLHRRIRMIARFPRHADRHAAGFGLLGFALFAAIGCTTLTGPNPPAQPPGPPQQPAASGQQADPAPQSTEAKRPSPSPAEAADLAAQAMLDRRLPELDLDRVALRDVIEMLRDKSGANLFVNWKALEAAGVARETPVTARLRNVRLSKALSVILDEAAGPTVKLGYTVDDGVVTITTGEDLAKNTIIRVYDVRDLIVQVPEADDDRRDFSGGGVAPSPASPTTRRAAADTAATATTLPAASWPGEAGAARQKSVDELVRLVRETVAPDSWREAGGSVGAIKELSGQLVVTQTPEHQRQVEQLLKQMRETRGIQVMVEARFIAVDDATADAVNRVTDPAAKDAAAPAAARPATDPAALRASPVFLDDAAVKEVLRVIEAGGKSTVLSAPRIISLNGQRAYIQIGNEVPAITDFRKVPDAAAGGAAAARYEPVTDTVFSGLTLDVSSTVSADRKYVTMTLRPQFSTLLAINEAPWPERPAGSDLTVKVPLMKVSELRTTISVPDGGTLLLSGLEEPGDAADAKARAAVAATRPAEAKPRKLVMLVKPTVIVRREGEPKASPLLHTKPEAGR